MHSASQAALGYLEKDKALAQNKDEGFGKKVGAVAGGCTPFRTMLSHTG
jgi:hypothetical protein